MRNTKHSIKTKAALVGVGLIICGSATAFAATTSHGFSDSIPAFQQSHYLNSYQRSSSTANSTIEFTAISDSQLMNVKAQNLQTNGEYTELNGIGVGSLVGIVNKTPAGQMSRLVITNHDWNFLSPTATGTFVIH
jgi:hypothetical protein